MKNSGLFLNMANGVFWVWFFWGFILKRFVFGVSGIVSKVLKMLVFFPVFWAFLGWLVIVHLGLEGLGVFVFLVFVFLCCVAFVSVLFALLLVLFLVLFFVLFFSLVFCFFVCLVFFVLFFGGFKGQVRWPKGPPHLALNPPYFLVFVFVCCFFFCLFFLVFVFLFLFFLEGLGVRWGGPKGHLTWP